MHVKIYAHAGGGMKAGTKVYSLSPALSHFVKKKCSEETVEGYLDKLAHLLLEFNRRMYLAKEDEFEAKGYRLNFHEANTL